MGMIYSYYNADLMAILRMAVESRKVQLVDIALDLIQKLIAHHHIQGPVFSISHRRETGGKRRPTEDEDELESIAGDSSLPQVSWIGGFSPVLQLLQLKKQFIISNLATSVFN